MPDLIVEVVSPNDSYVEVEERVEEHLRAGVSLAWIVLPEIRVVMVYHANDSASQRLHEDDELSGEQILPGFRCRVKDIFAPLEFEA